MLVNICEGLYEMDDLEWKDFKSKAFDIFEDLEEIIKQARRVEGLGWLLGYDKGVREHHEAMEGLSDGIEAYAESIIALAQRTYVTITDLTVLLSDNSLGQAVAPDVLQ